MHKLFSPAIFGVAGAALLLGALPILSGPQNPTFLPIGQPARADEPAPAPKPEELAEKAYLVLEKNCVSCHGAGKRLARRALIDRKGYKTLVEEQGLVVPGKPDNSEVYTLMADGRMPPRNAQVKPTAEDLALLKTWIEQGAPAWKEEVPAPPAAP